MLRTALRSFARESVFWGVVAESVQLATIVLTDLVESTRLAASVGSVRADELREEHFACPSIVF